MCRARAMETSEAPLRQASSTFGTCSSGITYLGWPGPLPASTAVDPRCSAQCSLSWLALNALFPLDFHYQDLLINDQRGFARHSSRAFYAAGIAVLLTSVHLQRPSALKAFREDGALRSPWEIGRAHVELQSLMRISYAVFCLKKNK